MSNAGAVLVEIQPEFWYMERQNAFPKRVFAFSEAQTRSTRFQHTYVQCATGYTEPYRASVTIQ